MVYGMCFSRRRWVFVVVVLCVLVCGVCLFFCDFYLCIVPIVDDFLVGKGDGYVIVWLKKKMEESRFRMFRVCVDFFKGWFEG